MCDVLVLAPHVDDETLGCGATIARFVEEGRKVRVVAFSRAEISLPEGFTGRDVADEFFLALKALGCIGHICNFPTRDFDLHRQSILDVMVELRDKRDPEIVICPSLIDMHQDHKIIAEQAYRAFWNKSILGFESIRKCKRFDARVYVPVTLEHVTKKMEAIQCYKSQLWKDNFPGEPNYIMAQARLRGLQIGTHMAEAYEVLQWKI